MNGSKKGTHRFLERISFSYSRELELKPIPFKTFKRYGEALDLFLMIEGRFKEGWRRVPATRSSHSYQLRNFRPLSSYMNFTRY